MAQSRLPRGFKASGVHCGIKRFNKDLALIYTDSPAKAAGVFTKNRVKAAPIHVTRDVLSKGLPIHAIIINSGNANCCTGKNGNNDAKKMAQVTSENLGLKFNNVCVASTGIIGKRLPIDDIVRSIPVAVKRLSEKGLKGLAKAILTTDRREKIKTLRFSVDEKEVNITGVCKGAGMICPNMATMLCFIMTDANVEKDALNTALKRAVNNTFNRITIDGDMSTNDCVLILANGRSENKIIRKNTKSFELFLGMLNEVCLHMAEAIVKGGEGATKFVRVNVCGAKTEDDAVAVARSIADSCLVKTSVHGQDANWGRIAASIGASMAGGISQKRMEIYLDGVCMFKKGTFTNPSGRRTSRIYKKKAVRIDINLRNGSKCAGMFTCDLSKRYVEINSHYLT